MQRVELLLGDSGIAAAERAVDSGSPRTLLAGWALHGRRRPPEPIRTARCRAELAALLHHPVRRHLVLIDDARLFTGTDGYPTIDELRTWVERERPGSRVDVEADIIRCALDAADAVS